jgi:peptidyl-prolyl cis-trans isomerase A (cyclophilin A)
MERSMNWQRLFATLCSATVFVSCFLIGRDARSTVVRFNTSLGNVDVRLYNTAAPLNVANFLNYVNNSLYNGTFIHRDVPGFVIQGGGYTYNATSNTAPHITQFAQVQNEFGISNTTGTIAMAKLPAPADGGPANGGPNSATSEWFFNLSDNGGTSPNGLDYQNGGFTVFGRVLGNGMNIVNQIAALPQYDLDGTSGSTFDDVPLRSTTSTLSNELVFVNNVTVLNYKAGDFNFDGTVNAADYAVWRNTYGSTTNAAADANGNGKVDAADYVLFRKTLGQSGGPGSGSGALENLTVPEPAAYILLVVGYMVLGIRRHNRNGMN